MAQPSAQTFDPTTQITEIRDATDRLLATAARLTDTMLDGPSLLPGWTRGHVLAHVARNADSLVNLLTWARTGRRTPQYLSPDVRNQEIAAGSALPLRTLLRDLRESAERFESAVADMPHGAWGAPVHMGAAAAGPEIPASRVLWQRHKEVEIHHVDLDAGYHPTAWPAHFVAAALDETCRRFSARDDVVPFSMLAIDTGRNYHVRIPISVPTISGSEVALLAWLIGRSKGADLTVQPAGLLPQLPPWA